MTKVGFTGLTGDGPRCFGEVAEACDAPVSALFRRYRRGLYEVIGALDGEAASLRFTSGSYVGFVRSGAGGFGEVASACSMFAGGCSSLPSLDACELIEALDGETASLWLTSPPGCSGSLVSVEACA